MNILLINHYAGSPSHGMEYRPFYMARSSGRARAPGDDRCRLAIARPHRCTTLRGNYTRESIEGVDYIWLKTPSYEGNGPRRALNLFAFVGQLLGHGQGSPARSCRTP